MKIIAIEEHFTLPGRTVSNPIILERTRLRLKHDLLAESVDLDASRIAAMDAAGVTMQVLSCTGIQALGADVAVPVARETNDAAHAAVQRHPDRFAAFAALPTADPPAAVREFERAVSKLGFKGALIGNHTRGEYMDDKKFWPIFEYAESVDLPIYLHPSAPHPLAMQAYFKGFEDIATAPWGYAIDTATHFLRLVFAGVFDAFPRLKIILGHYGEGLPFWITRTNEHTRFNVGKRGLKYQYQDYIRNNLWVTCSGHFNQPAFLCTMLMMGIEKVMFAVDWPFEDNRVAVDYLMGLPISEADRHGIAHGNAERLLKLPSDHG
jgi:predicted TIM-barrel fold metal-dependent hydrolase